MLKPLIILIVFHHLTAFTLHAESEFKVMAWNIWGRLNQDKRYEVNEKSARTRTIEIIKDSQADIITMIETYGSAATIAKQLGYHHYTPSAKANLCIFSRYKLTNFGVLKGLSSFSYIRATARISPTQSVRIYCIWLTSRGRNLVEVKNKTLSDADYIKGDANRHAMIQQFLNHPEVKKDLAMRDRIPVIVAGDFNCVSHLDYTAKSAREKLNYGRVFTSTPTHAAMLDARFTDTYRATNPLSQNTLGYTWTTVGKGYKWTPGKGFEIDTENLQPERRGGYARIDFIYSTGKNLKPMRSQVIKHYKKNTQHSFLEFPSDHAAVLTTFKLRVEEIKKVPETGRVTS